MSSQMCTPSSWHTFEATISQCTKEIYVLLDLVGVSHQKAAAPAVMEDIKHPERLSMQGNTIAAIHAVIVPLGTQQERRPTMHTMKSADNHFSPPGCHPLSQVMMPIPISTTPTIDT